MTATSSNLVAKSNLLTKAQLYRDRTLNKGLDRGKLSVKNSFYRQVLYRDFSQLPSPDKRAISILIATTALS
ncbi:hypothetical protein [Nostoc sp.]|uniref:hypothetical protein n=1 Tax=Nostoc sp. TaxID=1180 RepID=UPI002FF4993A